MTDFIETVPRRRVTACALFLNKDNEILIMKPTYRNDDDWLIAGGVVEHNESPFEGCKRKVREEQRSSRLGCLPMNSPIFASASLMKR